MEFFWGDNIDISSLIKKNKEKLSNTDLVIAREILENGIDYNLSINDLAEKCYTSRTSVLRFAKKIGFSGYSELKFYINENEDENKSEKASADEYTDIFKKLSRCEKILIYGNGYNEEIVKLAIKSLFMHIGIVAEVYLGGAEMVAFNANILDGNCLFVVDFNNDLYSNQLLLQISSINCLKISVGKAQTQVLNADYSIYYNVSGDKFNLLSTYISHLEDFVSHYKEARDNGFNWISYRELW